MHRRSKIPRRKYEVCYVSSDTDSKEENILNGRWTRGTLSLPLYSDESDDQTEIAAEGTNYVDWK